MSLAIEQRLRDMQEHILDLLRRVAELEKQAQSRTLRLPKDKP
jgi:hypothetical protein